jgi:Fe-S-cluster formation regulator IscX/YfhJ
LRRYYKVRRCVAELDEIQESHDELNEKFLEEKAALEAGAYTCPLFSST